MTVMQPRRDPGPAECFMIGRPQHGSVAPHARGEVLMAIPFASLVGDHADEQRSTSIVVAEQRRANLGIERQLGDHSFHRLLQNRIEQRTHAQEDPFPESVPALASAISQQRPRITSWPRAPDVQSRSWTQSPTETPTGGSCRGPGG